MDPIEREVTLHDYLHIVKKRRMTFVIPCAVLILVGFCLTFSMPAVYEAECSMLIERGDRLGPQSEDPNVMLKFLEMARSMPLIEQTCQALELGLPPATIRSNLNVSIDRNGAVLRVALQGTDRQKIHRFLAGQAGGAAGPGAAGIPGFGRRLEAESEVLAKGFHQNREEHIVRQLQLNQRQLEAIEAGIASFQQLHRLISVPDELAQAKTQYERAQSDLAQTRFEFDNVKRRMEELSARLAGLGKSGIESAISGEVVVQLRQELIRLEIESITLAQTYQETHPRVIELRDKVAFLQKRIAEEAAKAMGGRDPREDAVVNNAVAEMIRLEGLKVTLEARLAYLAEAARGAHDRFERYLQQRQDYAALVRQQKTLEQSQNILVERLNQARIEKEATRGNLRLFSVGPMPDRPVHPNVKMYLLLTAMVSVLVSVVLVFLAEQLDTSIKTSEEAKRLMELPLRGLIPDLGNCDRYVAKNREPLDPKLCAVLYPTSSEAEAFRTLRTNLLHLHQQSPFQTFMITSATEQVGKSTIIANTAIVLAQAGYRVILVDTDLRRPAIHKYFRVENTRGLTNLMTGVPFPEVVRDTPVKQLRIITSGPLPPNPAELLQTESFSEVVTFLKTQADFVLFDNPPINAVTDGLILATRMQRVFYLVALGQISRKEVEKGLDSLRGLRCDLAGLICNWVKPYEMGGYYYHYGVR